jgi:hypothetical protein
VGALIDVGPADRIGVLPLLRTLPREVSGGTQE